MYESIPLKEDNITVIIIIIIIIIIMIIRRGSVSFETAQVAVNKNYWRYKIHLNTTGHTYAFSSSGHLFRCDRKIANGDHYLRHVCLSVRPSVCLSSWNNCAPTGEFFMKFDYLAISFCRFFEILSRKFNFRYNLTRITATLHSDLFIFMIISRSVLFVMRNVWDNICIENHKTHFMFNTFFSPKIVTSKR